MSVISTARDWAAQRPYAVSAALIVITLGSLFFAWQRSTSNAQPPHPARKVFLYNEATGEVLVRDCREIPPITTPDGASLVAAVFYTFDNGQTQRLAYLQKYSDEARIALTRILDNPANASDPDLHQTLKEGTFIRLPEPGSPWVTLDSPQASLISQRTLRQCPAGAVARVVEPQ